MSAANGHAPTYADLREAYAGGAAFALGWPSDLLDPYAFRRDDAGGWWLPLAQGGSSARKDGRNEPFVRTDADLDVIRGLAYWLTTKNDMAIGAMSARRDYAIKHGYRWEARPADGQGENPRALELAAQCQRVIDRDAEANGLPQRERSAFWRAGRDGECLVRHFTLADGAVAHRFVRAEQLRDPGHLGPEGSFGIECDPDDVETPLYYWITYDGGASYEQVPACEISHLKRNVDEEIKRGVSDFFSCGEAFDEVAKLLRAMRRGGTLLAKIAWIEEFANTTNDQLAAFQTQVRDQHSPRFTNPLSGKPQDTQYFPDGKVIYTKDNRKFQAPPLAGNTGNFTQIADACLRTAGTRWRIPEHIISGNASQNNVALILVAGAPFVCAIECEQDEFGPFFRKWRWVAIEAACRARVIRADLDEVRELVQLHYTPPQVAVANPEQEASVDEKDMAAGVLSLQTRAARRGLDFEQERKNIAEFPPTRLAGKATDLDAQGNPVGRGQGGQGTAGGAPQRTEPSPQAVQALQVAVYGGQLPREAAVMNVRLAYGLDPSEAASLFPEVPPQRTADEAPPKGPPVPLGESREEAEEDADAVDPGTLADLFYGIYGDEALAVLRKLGGLTESWDAASHPRGKGGRFIPKGSAEAVAAAKDVVSRALAGEHDADPKELLDHLSILTKQQIMALAKAHGKTAPKLLRAQLVDAVQQVVGQKKGERKAAEAEGVGLASEDEVKAGGGPKDAGAGDDLGGLDVYDTDEEATRGHAEYQAKEQERLKAARKEVSLKGTPADRHVEDALDAGLSALPAGHADAYRKSAAAATSRMPRHAKDRLASNLGAAHFGPTSDDVVRAAAARARAMGDGEAADHFDGMVGKSVAFYQMRERSLNLDGSDESLLAGHTGPERYGLGRGDSQTGLYAHEMTHAIDGPEHHYSGGDDWRAVHEGELAGDALTSYASTSPSEAFAEFGRLVYGGQADLADVGRSFPQASKFFEDNGLWPEQGGDGPAEIADVFDKSARVDLGKAGHVDVLKPAAPATQPSPERRAPPAPPARPLPKQDVARPRERTPTEKARRASGDPAARRYGGAPAGTAGAESAAPMPAEHHEAARGAVSAALADDGASATDSVPVAVKDVRRKMAGLSKQQQDAALWSMVEAGELHPVRHNQPGTLSALERSHLLEDPTKPGTYYVDVAPSQAFGKGAAPKAPHGL